VFLHQDAAGELVLLADQDRARWDRARIEEDRQLVLQVLGLLAAKTR
jgi:predicted RNA polymerase sigma factor